MLHVLSDYFIYIFIYFSYLCLYLCIGMATDLVYVSGGGLWYGLVSGYSRALRIETFVKYYFSRNKCFVIILYLWSEKIFINTKDL